MSISKSLGVVVISLALIIEVLAQQPCTKPQHGGIAGRLRDLCEEGIAEAAITAKSGRVKRKSKSDKAGNFEFCLPAGTYQIIVEKYGFKRYIVNDVEVKPNAMATVNLHMEAGYASDDPNAEKALLKPCPPPNKLTADTTHRTRCWTGARSARVSL